MKEKVTFVDEMKAFLDTPDKERDYDKGAQMLAQISGNTIRRNMMIRRGAHKFAEIIVSQIRNFYNFVLDKQTRETVAELQKESDKIIEAQPKEEKEIVKGKRADHDGLPDEIKAAYVETLDIMHRQRRLHDAIANLALAQTKCPASEIYPFVKEIVTLDKRRLSLWKQYDSYKAPAKS